jgi:hypothetical protein
MCWASNHQNIYRNGPRAHFLSVDNKQLVVPECVAEHLLEQQPGEGKCPLTHYVMLTL